MFIHSHFSFLFAVDFFMYFNHKVYFDIQFNKQKRNAQEIEIKTVSICMQDQES